MNKRSTRQTFVLGVVSAALIGGGFSATTQAAIPMNIWTTIVVDANNDGCFGNAAADVNGDGYKDIVSNKWLYINPGGQGTNAMIGAWQRYAIAPDVNNLDASVMLDMNGDNQPEIFAEALPDIHYLRKANAAGTQWTDLIVGNAPSGGHGNGQGWKVADIDPTRGGATGKLPEIVICAENSTFYYFVIAANPASAWTRVTIGTDAPDNQGVDAVDLDGDGFVDVTANYHDGNNIAWYKNPGNGAANWQPYVIGRTAQPVDRIVFGDFNGDGKVDIAYSESEGNGCQVGWMQNPGTPTQANWTKHVIVTQDGTYSMQTADIDQDGDLDLVTGETTNKHVRFWQNSGQGTFAQVANYDLDAHHSLPLIDLDGDGDLDVIVLGWFDRALRVLRNDGNPLNKPSGTAVSNYVALPQSDASLRIEKQKNGLWLRVSSEEHARRIELLDMRGKIIDNSDECATTFLRAPGPGEYVVRADMDGRIVSRIVFVVGK